MNDSAQHITRWERLSLVLAVLDVVWKQRVEVQPDRGEHSFDLAAGETVHEYTTVFNLANPEAWRSILVRWASSEPPALASALHAIQTRN